MAEGLSRFNNPELNKAQEPPPDTAEALREQIRQHEFIDQHRGLLDRATTNVLNRGDEKSLAALKELEQRVSQGRVNQGEIASAVKADRDALSWQGEVSMYGTGFMKATTLFLPGKGKIPWMAAGAVHAVDQIKIAPDISAGEVVADGLLGFGKGAGLKITMDKVSASSWRTWEKGLVIGGAGGALETSLHRENWLNKEGKVDIMGGLGRTTQSSLFGAGAGAVTFHVGHKLFKGISAQTGGALERSGLASNMGVGFSFGVTGGFTHEALNQVRKGEFDPVQLAVRSLAQGGVDMLAGGTGYKASRLYMPESAGTHQAFNNNEQGPTLMSQLKGIGERFIKPTESTGESQHAGKTRRRGGDEDDGGNKGDWRDQLDKLSRQRGWGTQENQGGNAKETKTGNEEVVRDEVVRDEVVRQDETVPPVEKTARVETEVKPVEKAQPQKTELDVAQQELQARLDAWAKEQVANDAKPIEERAALPGGKLSDLDIPNAMRIYRDLPGRLRTRNGDEPIPELEARVLRERYKDLPDMIASAIAKARAEQSQTKATETDEIISGGEQVKPTADEYTSLLRRAAGEGQELSPVERRTLDELHEVRKEARQEELDLDARISAVRSEIETARATTPSEVSEGPKVPEGFQKGEATWRNKDNDVPVEITEYLGEVGGRHYVKVKGVETGIPLDEIVFPKATDINLERPLGLTSESKTVSIPEIDVVRDTNGMFGTTQTQGNTLLKEAVIDATLATVGEGNIKSDAAARLRELVVAEPELKPALEMIAGHEKNKDLRPAIEEAIAGVEVPPPAPARITLKDIETRRPNELAEKVQEGINLADKASKGDTAAQQQLNELARNSTDATDPSKPVFDIQAGMARVAAAKPELARSIYEAYRDTLQNSQLGEFGVRFAKEAVEGDAAAKQYFEEFVRRHNHEDVKRSMIDAAMKSENAALTDIVYENYKDALTINDKLFFGGKFLRDANTGGQAEMDNLIKFARENPEPEVLDVMRLFADTYPEYAKTFRRGFGVLDAPQSDLKMITEAGKLIDAKQAELLGQPAAESSMLKFMAEVSDAIAARRWEHKQSFEKAQQDIVENIELLAQMKGIENPGFLTDVVKNAPWPTDMKALEAANKLFDVEVATRKAAEAGEAKPEAGNTLEFIRTVNQAMQERVNAGMSVPEAAAAIKKNLDRIAESKGLEQKSDFLNEAIAEAAVPSRSDGEDLASKLGLEVLETQVLDAKAAASGAERKGLSNGEDFVRALWAEMWNGPTRNVDVLERVRARLEIHAALKGLPDANNMLPYIAEVATFGHESGARPGTSHLEVNVSAENQVDVMKRTGEFRQIVQNSRLPQDPMFTGTPKEGLNQWFEHYMKVRGEVFEWLNNNRDLWDYARAYAANTEYSPIASMIDAYPHMDTRFLSDFPSYDHRLLTPTPKREAPTTEEVVSEGAKQTETTEVAQPEVQINPTVSRAVENMNSGEKALQIQGALESQYLMNPRARGVEQFARWRQIVSTYAAELPPQAKAIKELFSRPEIQNMSDAALMEFLSSNQAPVQFRKGGWTYNDDVFNARANDLQKALDAFKTADMKDPSKADQPGMADATAAATALGVKLATEFANNRPLLNEVMFKINDESPFRTQYKEMLALMLENPGGGAKVKEVLDAFKAIQDVRQTYLPRQPKPRPGEPRPPRIELTPEQNMAMMGEIQGIVYDAQTKALETKPSNPEKLVELIENLAYGKGPRDETPRKPFGPGGPGGPKGGGDRRPPR